MIWDIFNLRFTYLLLNLRLFVRVFKYFSDAFQFPHFSILAGIFASNSLPCWESARLCPKMRLQKTDNPSSNASVKLCLLKNLCNNGGYSCFRLDGQAIPRFGQPFSRIFLRCVSIYVSIHLARFRKLSILNIFWLNCHWFESSIAHNFRETETPR